MASNRQVAGHHHDRMASGINQTNNDFQPPPGHGATEETPLVPPETNGSTAAAEWQAGDANDNKSEPDLSVKRSICIILSMWVLIFLQASNMSGMTMVQSTIARDLDAYRQVTWFTSAYLITCSSLAPLSGRLAAIFTPGVMIMYSSVFFAAGAVATSQAQSLVPFLLGRVLIGIGGSGVMVLSLILVLQLTDKRRRGVFVGMVNAGFTIGLSSGAVIFGALLPLVGWRILFLLQAPLGLVAGVGVYASIPDYPYGNVEAKSKSVTEKLKGIDYAGAVLLTTTLALFLYGLADSFQPLPVGISLVTLTAFILVEYRFAADPIIPISILQSRGTLLTCLAQLGFMASRWTLLYYGPIFALAVRGFSLPASGSFLIPTNAGFGLGGLLVGWLHICRAGSFYIPCLTFCVLFGASLACVSGLATAAAPIWAFIVVIFVNGLFTGALLNYTLAHLLHLTPPATHFLATSLLQTFRGFAGSFGTTIGGGFFMRSLEKSLDAGFESLDGHPLTGVRRKLVTQLVGSPALVWSGELNDAERAVAIKGYEDALRLLFISAVGLTVVVFFLQAGTGRVGPGTDGEEEVAEAEVEHERDG